MLMEGSCGLSVDEPPMSPRSLPGGGGVDLYGRRRQMIKVQALEREIGLLQEELKSVEDLPPASRICKELDDFLATKQDPLIIVEQKTLKAKPFWKRFWVKFRSNFLCCCCSSGCLHHLLKQNCCTCCAPSHSRRTGCCCCLRKTTCQDCCKCMGFSCLCHTCCCFNRSSALKCKKLNLCSNFAKSCHNTCCL